MWDLIFVTENVWILGVCVRAHTWERSQVIFVCIYEPLRAKVYICGCECVICVQEHASMFAVEAEGPPLRPPGLLRDVPAAGPDVRGARGEKQAWCGHPVGAGFSLVNERPEVRSQSPAGPGQDHWQDPPRGSRLGWGCAGPGGASWPGTGGPVFSFPKNSSVSPGFVLAPLWPW